MFEFLLQNPPKPVQAWPPEPPPISVNFTRPNAWADKLCWHAASNETTSTSTSFL
uniref:Uncharacterized protein n=1 Tax=Meloidogyne incognita TaxID=6306 RepID=A0A914LGW4_MELIC